MARGTLGTVISSREQADIDRILLAYQASQSDLGLENVAGPTDDEIRSLASEEDEDADDLDAGDQDATQPPDPLRAMLREAFVRHRKRQRMHQKKGLSAASYAIPANAESQRLSCRYCGKKVVLRPIAAERSGDKVAVAMANSFRWFAVCPKCGGHNFGSWIGTRIEQLGLFE